MAELGLFLGESVLGPEILKALAGTAPRTLLLRLPRAADPLSDAPLISALARIPWELARGGADSGSLADRNLVPRLLLDGSQPATAVALDLEPGEDLRCLLVFAEAPGLRPLAMRQERERLLSLFCDQVQPVKWVRIDCLCHGVSRDGLRRQVTASNGYHLLHRSGHRHRNLLEVQGADSRPDHLTGEDLAGLLTEAGGFYPRLVFSLPVTPTHWVRPGSATGRNSAPPWV